MDILFSKKERKFSKNRIDDLYKYGERIYGQSLIIIWRYIETDTLIPVQLLISVPKKKIKKAVNRNYIKRIIRQVLIGLVNMTRKRMNLPCHGQRYVLLYMAFSIIFTKNQRVG